MRSFELLAIKSPMQNQVLTSEETRRLTGMVAKTRALFESKENLDRRTSSPCITLKSSPREFTPSSNCLGLSRKISNKENVVHVNESLKIARNKSSLQQSHEKQQQEQQEQLCQQKENSIFQPVICRLKKINTNTHIAVNNVLGETKFENDYNLPTSVKQAKQCFESLAQQTHSSHSSSPDFTLKFQKPKILTKNDESSSASSVSSVSSFSSYNSCESKPNQQRFAKPILSTFDKTQTQIPTSINTATRPAIHRIVKLENCVSQIAKDIISDYKMTPSDEPKKIVQTQRTIVNRLTIKEEDNKVVNEVPKSFKSRFALNTKSHSIIAENCSALPSNIRNRSQSLVDPSQIQQNPIKKVYRTASSAREALLRWCKYMTQDYTNVKIENFSSSWSNGLAFCALIHSFMPDAFDFSKLSAANQRYNFELAFKVAESAGIVSLLDVDDMIEMEKPDYKCVMTYVHSIYQRFKDETNLKR